MKNFLDRHAKIGFPLLLAAVLLLSVVAVANAAAILYTDAAKVLGQMKMTIVANPAGDKFVFYKFKLQFSGTGTPVNFCYAGQLVNPASFDEMPDISIFDFLQYYGPLPNTLVPIPITDPWCDR